MSLLSPFSSFRAAALRAASHATLLLAAVPAFAVAAPGSPEDQVVHVARAVLVEQAQREGLSDPRFSIKAVTNDRTLLSCPRPLSITAADAQRRSRMKFTAACPDTSERTTFIVRVEASAEVLVAASDLPSGRIIGDDDLMLERREITNLPDVVSDARDVVGQAARRPIRTGQVLMRKMLAAPQLVKRGEPVRIQVRSGPIEVDAAGEALEAGQHGDVIRVRNSNTGKIIRGRVIGHSVVEPISIPAAPQSTD